MSLWVWILMALPYMFECLCSFAALIYLWWPLLLEMTSLTCECNHFEDYLHEFIAGVPVHSPMIWLLLFLSWLAFWLYKGKVDFDQRTCEISRDCFSQYVVLGGWNSHWKPWLELAAAGEMPGTPSQFQVSVYCLPSPVIRHVACWNQMWFSGGKLVNSNIDVLP